MIKNKVKTNKGGEMKKGFLKEGRNQGEACYIIENEKIVLNIKWNTEKVEGNKSRARMVAAKWAIENGLGCLMIEYDGKIIDYLPIFRKALEAHPSFRPQKIIRGGKINAKI